MLYALEHDRRNHGARRSGALRHLILVCMHFMWCHCLGAPVKAVASQASSQPHCSTLQHRVCMHAGICGRALRYRGGAQAPVHDRGVPQVRSGGAAVATGSPAAAPCSQARKCARAATSSRLVQLTGACSSGTAAWTTRANSKYAFLGSLRSAAQMLKNIFLLNTHFWWSTGLQSSNTRTTLCWTLRML